jgi:hypothetical protein
MMAMKCKKEIREEMRRLIQDYSFKNKKRLKDIFKITWSDN